MENKLLDMMEENEHTLASVQEEKGAENAELKLKIKQLEGDYSTLLIKLHNSQDAFHQLEDQKFKH
jgi:predicted nuclease with TOPRIM domain